MSPALMFQVAPGSAEPIYRQIIDQVRRLVAGGQLSAGEELPSVRDVAAQLAVNPMTISKAYSLLEAEGLLERRRGKGMLIAAQFQRARSLRERQTLLQPSLETAAQQARELEIPIELALSLFREYLEKNR